MWDLIVSVPDHCLSFYFVYGVAQLHSSWKKKLNDFSKLGVVPCGGRKTSPRTSTIVQFIFYFGPLRSATIF